MKDERVYLEHILACLDAIHVYTNSERASLDDPKTRDAVIRRLQVMAESTLRLSDERKADYPAVGWQGIRNFRNRLVHEYLDVRLDIVWAIIEKDLPLLRQAIINMLSEPNEDKPT